MPIGLEIYDVEENPLFSVTTHVGRFLGSFSTGGQQEGSVVDSRIINHSAFAYTALFSGKIGGPTFTFDNTTGRISWKYSYVVNGTESVNAADMTHTVRYGIY